MPKQTSTDCGSENALICGLSTALKEAFAANRADVDNEQAHIFLNSMHHLPFGRGWLDFRNNVGHNFPHFWSAGSRIFDEENLNHRYLAMWLWPPVLQKELDRFYHFANNRRIRKQRDTMLPSGVAPMFSYLFPERFGAHDCLQPVDLQVVEEIIGELEEEKERLSDWGVPEEFKGRANVALEMTGIDEVTITNIWAVFAAMLRYLH